VYGLELFWPFPCKIEELKILATTLILDCDFLGHLREAETTYVGPSFEVAGHPRASSLVSGV
jgi:hypothetical protein